jgi:hypothetical protein
MWHLLRKTSTSFRRRGGAVFKHINDLGTNNNLVNGPGGTRKQGSLCCRKPVAIYCYAMLCYAMIFLPINSCSLFILYREGRGLALGPFPCQGVLPIFYLSLYGSTALVNLGRYFSFLIYTQTIGLLGRGSARCKAATYTQNNTNRE